MRTRWIVAVFCALWLAAPAAPGAGFEGLRADDPGQPAVAGTIDEVNAEKGTFRIGGLTFRPAPGVVDFATLAPGRFAAVSYREDGDRLVATRVEFRKPRGH
jgi:hypothetical protein